MSRDFRVSDYNVHVTRRLRGDMVEVFKILHDFENIDQEHFLVYSRSTLTEHN